MLYKFFQIITFILMSSSAFALTPSGGDFIHERPDEALSGIKVHSSGPYVSLRIFFGRFTANEFREYSKQFIESLSPVVKQLDLNEAFTDQRDRWKFKVETEGQFIDAYIHIIDGQDVFFESFFNLVFDKINEITTLTTTDRGLVFSLLSSYEKVIAYTSFIHGHCNCGNSNWHRTNSIRTMSHF